MNQTLSETRPRFQVRLGDIAVVVVASAYVLDVVRRSREAWQAGTPYQDQVLGLIVLTLGVVLGLIVLAQGFRRFRERDRAGRIGSLTWRILALGGLAWGLAETAEVVQFQRFVPRGFSIPRFMRLELIPLLTAFGMVGLVLALSPIRRLARGSSFRPGWKSWLMVILATATGLIYLAEGHGIIPYLVLIAIEAVQNAMRRAPVVSRPIVFDRLDLACLEALPGLVGCLLSACWINDDIRTTASNPTLARTPRSWLGMLGRVATVALAVGGAGFVWFSSIPRLSVPIAEGIALVFDPATLVSLVLGFAGLAAGIAAQGAARLVVGDEWTDPAGTPSRRIIGVWSRRIIAGVVGLTALEITAAAMQKLYGDVEYRWYIPFRLSDWISFFQSPAQSLGFTGALNIIETLLYQPSLALIPLTSAWLVYRMIRLVASKSSDPTAAVDLVATDRLALGRFLGWWLSLTLLMLASLPILGVVGITLTHHGIIWMAR